MTNPSYKPEIAANLNSVVSAVLINYCHHQVKGLIGDESGHVFFESASVQFDLGMSDIEFYSALKILRDSGLVKTKNTKAGKIFICHELLSDAAVAAVEA